MPLYMDIHVAPGATPAALEEAHNADLAIQDKHCVHCLKYWFNEEAGKVFCLVDAPSPEAARRGPSRGPRPDRGKDHRGRSRHGRRLLGPGGIDRRAAPSCCPTRLDRRDTGVRTVLFTDIVDSTEMTSRYGDDADHGDAVASTTASCATRCARMAAARSSTPATASWPPSSRPPSAVRCACQVQASCVDA